jgi:hypothetical protein
MPKEQRVTRASAEAMVSRIMHAIGSGAEQSTIDFMGSKLLVEKGANDGYIIRAPGQPAWAHFYLPTSAPPAEFPAALPFVPNEALMLSRPEHGALTLVWWAPRDPEKLFATVEQQSASANWLLQSSSDPLTAEVLQRSYLKEGLTRRVFMSDGVVTLIQTIS